MKYVAHIADPIMKADFDRKREPKYRILEESEMELVIGKNYMEQKWKERWSS